MMRWDLARSSLEDSSKGSGSSLGTRREIAGKKTGGLAARMLKAAGLCGSKLPVPQNPDGGQWLTIGKLPRSVGEMLVPRFFRYD
ncbi:hypothetical protein B296_00052813 [Ensete ventricosum]|uniref:Uncharacterized protein n=1 Tax=Ensete ventricosum TaxID=4639 RepID=A0A426WYJ1_ENSVE|nr:hypothetical protein B296_00052813 [Ensete ventricosum]